MANTDNPHGLKCLGRSVGGGYIELDLMQKAVGTAAALFIQDAVARLDTGYLGRSADISPGTTLYDGVNLSYGAASTLTDHLVIVDPFAIFEAQDDADTDGFAFADTGLNCNLVLNAGSAATLLSGHELDEATINTTNTLDVHLLKKLDVPDNAYGEFCRMVITFNKHRRTTGVAGV